MFSIPTNEARFNYGGIGQINDLTAQLPDSANDKTRKFQQLLKNNKGTFVLLYAHIVHIVKNRVFRVLLLH